MTWARYRTLVISDPRIANGRAAYRAPRLLARSRIATACRQASSWASGGSNPASAPSWQLPRVQALATLAWDGRRAAFFRSELLAALRILDHGDISPARMTGSYAGAMGQPQFMPSAYLRYAVDFEGSGRRDIWASTPDTLASIANYLARAAGGRVAAWGHKVTLAPGFPAEDSGRDDRRPVGEWMRLGVPRPTGARWPRRTPGGADPARWTGRRGIPGLSATSSRSAATTPRTSTPSRWG